MQANQGEEVMKKILAALAMMSFGTAHAYEYTLQFTPPSGAKNVNVVGYDFTADGGVSGLIHYALTRCSSGRGAHCTTTQYDYSATWDSFGHPTGSVAGAPTAPAPLYVDGTRTVYADNGTSKTGSDTALAGVDKGFVMTPSPHYSWQAPSGQLFVIPDAPYTFSAPLLSDGDFNVDVAQVTVSAAPSGSLGGVPDQGVVSISSNGCGASVAPGASCAYAVTYDPTTIRCTPSTQGLIYTTVTLTLSTDAGQNFDFTQIYTVTGVPVCDD
jgi:hypothetical protein